MNDAASRTRIEIDVAVFAPQEPGRKRRVLSAAGFHDDLRATRDPRLALVTLGDIYALS